MSADLKIPVLAALDHLQTMLETAAIAPIRTSHSLSSTAKKDDDSESIQVHRPISIIGHLSSSSSLKSLRNSPSPTPSLSHSQSQSSPPLTPVAQKPIVSQWSKPLSFTNTSRQSLIVDQSQPLTLCSLPSLWLARIFSYLSPTEKLIDLLPVNRRIHEILTQIAASFADDYLELSPALLPQLSMASPPWFKGLRSVSARASAPAWFELDTPHHGTIAAGDIGGSSRGIDEESEGDGDTPNIQSPSLSSTASPSISHNHTNPVIHSPSSTGSHNHGTMSPFASPFASIRSLCISLSSQSSTEGSPMIDVTQSNMFSGFHKWRGLRYLEIHADDDGQYDSLSTAPTESALLRKQDFRAFTSLPHLHTLILDATVRSDQIRALTGMTSLTCLLMTEREQRQSVGADPRREEDESMMAALGLLARKCREGRGLIKLRMPKFSTLVSADNFCYDLIDEELSLYASPLHSLHLQGSVSKRGIQCLSMLSSLSILTMNDGCDIHSEPLTLQSLSHCRMLEIVECRVIDPKEDDDHDYYQYVPSLPALEHLLRVQSLTSLTLHLPPHAWQRQHSESLAALTMLRKLTLTGDPRGIDASIPIDYAVLEPLIGSKCQWLHSLTLDWLPLTDDAIYALSMIDSLTALSLINCPYLTSALFYVLLSLKHLAKLKVYRCDVNLTEEGLREAEMTALAIITQYDGTGADVTQFQSLQVLECHLVHCGACDVDDKGFARFLSLLSPSRLHSFDFDSDYSTLKQFIQLESFPYLRSLGTPSVDVSPYDNDVTMRAKDSFALVERAYYSRQYTRIHRGRRKKWRRERRGSLVAGNDSELMADDDCDNDYYLDVLNECSDEDDDDRRDQQAKQINTEHRWVSHYNSVEFRHQQARKEFFEELKRIEREQSAVESSDSTGVNSANDTSHGQYHHSVFTFDTADEEEEKTTIDDTEDFADDYDADAVSDIELVEDDGYDDYSDGDDLGLTRQVSSSQLIGRSLKLHSRRWKRNEKAAIKSKAQARRGSQSSASTSTPSHNSSINVRWDYELARVVKLASLH